LQVGKDGLEDVDLLEPGFALGREDRETSVLNEFAEDFVARGCQEIRD
jgi:hypothetical protein